MKLVLLHSPLVGAGTWKAVAALLKTRGHEAMVPDLAPILRGDPPYYLRLAQTVAGAVGTQPEDTVLVVHSGAGALVSAIAERVPLRGAVFVDALLPHPGRSWFEAAPDALNTRLRKLVRDGKLPPWHLWWPKGAIEALLPQTAQFERFTGALSELPLAYFEERAPDTERETPGAYLQLSQACQADADRAEAAGWPVCRLELHHLAMLTHPDTVAPEIERLAACV